MKSTFKIRSGEHWYQGSRAGSWGKSEQSSPFFASRANAERAMRKGLRNARLYADRFGEDGSHLGLWQSAEIVEFSVTPV